MSQSNLGSIPPAHLARMMRLGSEAQRPWRPQELRDILRHQLDAPIELDCPATPAGPAATAGPTFRDVLCSAKPPLDLLERIKQFAKACRNNPTGPLPPEVATVLYFAPIAAALACWSQRITRLEDKDLRDGLAWCLALDWFDDPLRPILVTALNSLAM